MTDARILQIFTYLFAKFVISMWRVGSSWVTFSAEASNSRARPVVLAVGADGGGVFGYLPIFSSLLETTRYKLKFCLKLLFKHRQDKMYSITLYKLK